jgi:ATP-dependent HslUV protease ATP-binding subunit HslU
MIKSQRRKKLKRKIEKNVERKILDALVGPGDRRSRRDFRAHLRSGALDDQVITIEVPNKEADVGAVGSIHPQAANVLINFNKTLLGKKSEKKKMKISDCRPIIQEMETDRLLSSEDVTKEALEAVQQDGIVFLDEIDKICSTNDRHSADASAEGVQRDLLPLIEGSTINTKHGNVETDHILFIASGAFHSCKPSDLLAELQGRLPIRVNLKALSENDLYRVLTEPETNLIRQQVELIKTEDVELDFTPDSIREIAKVAHEANTSVENIGARRLHTVIERVMEEISYNSSNMEPGTKIQVTKQDVRDRVTDLLKAMDLRKYLL